MLILGVCVYIYIYYKLYWYHLDAEVAPKNGVMWLCDYDSIL